MQISFLTVIVLILISVGGEVSHCQTKEPESAETAMHKEQAQKFSQEVVAAINGNRLITQKEVDELIAAQLYNLQEKIYSLRKSALENLIARILIEEEAKLRHLSVAELIKG